MQLQAGYIIEGLAKLLQQDEAKEVRPLLASLSHFQLHGPAWQQESGTDPNAIFMVLENQMLRGLPTRLPLSVERKLVAAFPNVLTERETKIGGIEIGVQPAYSRVDSLRNGFWKMLHVTDPVFSVEALATSLESHPGEFDSETEKQFFLTALSELGGPGFAGLFQLQRSLKEVLTHSQNPSDDLGPYLRPGWLAQFRGFDGQRLDFSLEFPYPQSMSGFLANGVVIEIDGPHHKEPSQKSLDGQRDTALLAARWHTIRIPVEELGQAQHLRKIKDLLALPWVSETLTNYQQGLYLSTELGREVAQLALSPFVIARVQRVILECLKRGTLRLDQKQWTIDVWERDLPGAELAIHNLLEQIARLQALRGEEITLPTVDLTIYREQPLAESFLYAHSAATIKAAGDWDSSRKPDVWLDVSVLRRFSYESTIAPGGIQAGVTCQVRSSHGIGCRRKIQTWGVQKYPSFLLNEDRENPTEITERVEILTSLLQDIFRKQAFRPGQIGILNRALQGKKVVGLLPTGGGKSLTYQLAALLQPGITLVVDPIRSLMKDQYDSLRKNWIDACLYINSDLLSLQRKEANRKMEEGEILFCFVSPERFQVPSFRSVLSTMNTNRVWFSYCVIDEVHCVSEWGHDFRTSYLRLAKQARERCHTQNMPAVPLFGLTATASFDVLADVQRELDLSEEAIVSHESMKRKELRFEVIEVGMPEGLEGPMAEITRRTNLGTSKQDKILEIVRSHLGNEHAGLIFCPHRSWKFGVVGKGGITDVLEHELGGGNTRFGYFIGGDDDNMTAQSIQNQEAFINGDIQTMAATKAFGMGIDKADIRYVIHINMPSSVESYVQEAGRAGRDRDPAICYILHSGEQYLKPDYYESLDELGRETWVEGEIPTTVDKDILLSFFNNSFKGRKKEKYILHELLTNIRRPFTSPLRQITEELEEQFGLGIQWLSLYPRDQPHTIYVNGTDRKSWGGLRLKDRQFMTGRATESQEESVSVLGELWQKIDSNRPAELTSPDQVFTWLASEIPGGESEGILARLSREKESFISIPFENDAEIQIAQGIKNANGKDPLFAVRKAAGFVRTGEEFLGNLQQQINGGPDRPLAEREQKNALKWFPRIRKDQDTFKAVYRLSILGIIQDYVVDYNGRSIEAEILRLSDDELTENLIRYIEKYKSRRKAAEWRKKIASYYVSEHTPLERQHLYRCMSALIDFVYREIGQKRKQAIETMDQTCLLGLESGSEAMADFMDLYFSSRYANRHNDPNLIVDTNELQDISFDLVRKYVEEVEDSKDSWKHLRGACSRLLIERPEDYLFLLLNAYSTLLLEYRNERLVKISIEQLTKGFGLYYQELIGSSKVARKKLTQSYKWYRSQLIGIQSELREVVPEDPTFIIFRQARQSLESFNQKFLKGYDPGT